MTENSRASCHRRADTSRSQQPLRAETSAEPLHLYREAGRTMPVPRVRRWKGGEAVPRTQGGQHRHRRQRPFREGCGHRKERQILRHDTP
uniref:hypothetical protein n=1 Tax=Prevotella aurantiaca TaxID=596085 RepID=UPI001F349F28|nr:hypothetical protein [Prevotella aurantiaca]